MGTKQLTVVGSEMNQTYLYDSFGRGPVFSRDDEYDCDGKLVKAGYQIYWDSDGYTVFESPTCDIKVAIKDDCGLDAYYYQGERYKMQTEGLCGNADVDEPGGDGSIGQDVTL